MGIGIQLDKIEIEGFKSIKLLDLELRPMNVLIGANGSGKSNFISLFNLLNQMVEGNFQLTVQKAGGADTFLYFGQKVTEEIRIKLTFGQNAYSCVLIKDANNFLIFADEICYFHDRSYPKPYAVPLSTVHRESKLPETAKKERVARYVLDSLKNWKVYHFHDTSESSHVKNTGDINDNLYLRSDAGNLAAFLYLLQKTAFTHYEVIRNTIRLVAPFFDDFMLRPMPENENKIRLEWRERGSDHPFLAHHLSDGTLRFMCLVTLLLQPKLPSMIVIDEPELGLHPYAINVFASLMRSASKRTQLIVSTQSVTLVNQFEAEDLLVVDLKDHATTIERVDPERLAEWLEDYALGDLWEKNILGGRP